jgi:NCS1 family nucleobase:cation symporter-1
MLETYGAYIFNWLGAYGAMLGAFDGIAIADYWLVRKRRIDLAQLYTPRGIYSYAKGVNMRAVGALLIGWIVTAVGIFVQPLHFLWSGGWIFSLLGGLAAYRLFMRGESSTMSEPEAEATLLASSLRT